MRHVVVMVTTSYPRFPGDSVGTFMEPIASHVAARGHEVHIVAPWHPLVTRGTVENGVFFHFFKYAPVRSLDVFGYAAGMRADVTLRGAAWAAAPLALTAGWFKAMRVAQKRRATVMHGHWVVPGGALAATAAPSLPLVVSLHGSDVFVAERVKIAGRVAHAVFARAGFVTACSADLARRAIALGAPVERTEVVPYGVDIDRFRPDEAARASTRAALHADSGVPLIAAAGRLVRKKGFEYLLAALPQVGTAPAPVLAIAGSGDLDGELRAQARALGVDGRVRFLGNQTQDAVGRLFAAADLVVVPSIRDDSGNVDGLPNTVLEALASATPLVATAAGGIGAVVEHERTGIVVEERDPGAIAAAIRGLLREPASRALGRVLAFRLGTSRRSLRGRVRSGACLQVSPQLTFTGYPMQNSRPQPGLRKATGLSVFFPAYNDSGTIASLVIVAVRTARRLTDDYEVIVVNDGSADGTADILSELSALYPQVRVVHHERNRGYGGALRTGFAAATREVVFYTDGDAQYDPAEMEALWRRFDENTDLVNGYKISRSDPFHRIFIGRLYHHTVKLLFGLGVRDVDCDFRLMRRSIFDRVSLTKNSGVICLEMMKKIQDAGFRIAEVPVHHYHRAYGKSQFFNFKRLWKTAVDVGKLWYALVIRREHRQAAGAAAPAVARPSPSKDRP
jgi:glycosyltransferase involved in cell wall biosynthesis